MTPRFRKTTLIVAAVLSPLCLLTVLLAVSMINPMGLAFLSEFTLVNETADEVWVTPIGAVDREGRRATLPYSCSRRVCLLSGEDREFHIAPKSSRTLVYDWDDIQFSEILVRTSEGTFRVMSTGLHPTEGQYRRPQEDRFVLTDIGSLDDASQVHLKAMESGGRQRTRILYGLAFLGLAPPVLVFLALRGRRSKGAERNDAANGGAIPERSLFAAGG